jgi:hypothetical protein
MTQQKIPPQSEWSKLTVGQLYELKSNMTDLYYNAQRAGASYANQYLGFMRDVDSTIARAELKAHQEREAREKQINPLLTEQKQD